MDFLSAIPEPPIPMKPIGPSPDGTPPLPLLTQDVFDVDPFFNPLPPDKRPEVIPAPPPPDVSVPNTTAEERLLDTIIGTPEGRANSESPTIREEPLNPLRTELDEAIADARKAITARDLARQDLAILKTRFSALEEELAAARQEVTGANQSRSQTEARFEDAERQWTEKLGHLRSMLDDVEEIRDELFKKRVPKLLFVGTLVAGITASVFAYLIGAGHSITPDSVSDNPPPASTTTRTLVVPVAPPAKPIGAKPPMIVPPPVQAALTPTHPAIEKSADWSAFKGGRWTVTPSGKNCTVVFHYGIFTRGVEFSNTARQDLGSLAAALKGKPILIDVEGHTDPSKASKTKAYGHNNQAVGLARAKVVAHYLTQQCGVPAELITTSSLGETNPPYPNSTAENQQKNRTVVLKFTAR